MVLHKKDGTIEHRIFKEITDFFEKGDLFVLNNTKIIPSRYTVSRGNRKIDIILNRELNPKDRLWEFIIINQGSVEVDDILDFSDDLCATVIHKRTDCVLGIKECTLRFHFDGKEEVLKKTLFELGTFYIPDKVKALSQLDPSYVPVYEKFLKKYEQNKRARYVPENYEGVDTTFASQDGSICPSAAGLHFSSLVFNKMKFYGIDYAYITLHLGQGHFRTPDVDIQHFSWETDTKHFSWDFDEISRRWRWIDSQRLIISEAAAARINKTKCSRKKVVAVGASVMRGLQTKVSPGLNPISACDVITNEFIRHPYRFTVPDALITNFHMPCTPSLMCTAAFAGLDKLKNAYDEAIKEHYRFGPYGDAMLIL